MATFDGVDLGPVAVPLTVPNPRRRQVNAYPGVSGQEWLDMGSDGGVIAVETRLYADDVVDLAALEAALYAYQASGGGYAFVDNYGNSTPNVVLDLYEPTGRVSGAGDGGVSRPARLRFIYPL